MVVPERNCANPAAPPAQGVRVKQRRKRTSRLQLVLVILAVFGLGLLYTYQHSRMVALGYQIDRVQQNINVLQRNNRQLELKIGELQAPQRVEQIARKKLGMKEPGSVLLAAVPKKQTTPATPSTKTREQKLAMKNVWDLATHRLIGRAEASPQ